MNRIVSTMTIKPVKNDKNEGDVSPQHRDCLNKIASPKNPVSGPAGETRTALAREAQIDRIAHQIAFQLKSFAFCLQSTQHGIDQRSNLRGPGYVDEVHGNRHRRTNPKRYPFTISRKYAWTRLSNAFFYVAIQCSASSHSSTSGSNAQKSHKQRLGGHSSSHGTSASEASIAAANEAESVGSKPSTSVATNSLEVCLCSADFVCPFIRVAPNMRLCDKIILCGERA